MLRLSESQYNIIWNQSPKNKPTGWFCAHPSNTSIALVSSRTNELCWSWLRSELPWEPFPKLPHPSDTPSKHLLIFKFDFISHLQYLLSQIRVFFLCSFCKQAVKNKNVQKMLWGGKQMYWFPAIDGHRSHRMNESAIYESTMSVVVPSSGDVNSNVFIFSTYNLMEGHTRTHIITSKCWSCT